MHDTYVTAVQTLLHAGEKPDVVFANLKAVLERRGHLRLLPRILRVLEREVAQSEKSRQAKVIVARASDADSALVAELMQEIGTTKSQVHVLVDETIIGGAIVRHNHTESDASYKTALYTLYQSITK